MPSASLQISVSRREADRPRLLQIIVMDATGPVEGLAVQVTVDANGTFEDETQSRRRDLVSGSHGIALFQWFEWPRNGPAHDFTSTVTVTWRQENAMVYLEQLYE
jgi:hypothetical protein